MKSRIVSILLLLSVFILNTPKSWWHHCGHKIETSKSTEKSFSNKVVDCDFCDHDLSLFTVHEFDFFKILNPNKTFRFIECFSNASISAFDNLKLRGPPALIL